MEITSENDRQWLREAEYKKLILDSKKMPREKAPWLYERILEKTDGGRRQKASAYFSREFGFPLMTVADEYITPEHEMSEFLGFSVLDPSRVIKPFSPSEFLWELSEKQIAKAQDLRATRPAGAPTLSDIDPDFPRFPSTAMAMIRPQDIWLNNRQRALIRTTDEQYAPATYEATELVALAERQVRKRLGGVLGKMFGQGFSLKTIRTQERLERAQSSYRHLHDKNADLRVEIYAEALGTPFTEPLTIDRIEAIFHRCRSSMDHLWKQLGEA